ncbi:MAG: beta-galactosidase [Halanaerobiales bacterium]
MDRLLYGAAYYDEYMPYDRLEEDIKMMKEAGINLVRIAESTWSTLEPQNGEFNFYHIDRVLKAMHEAEIVVIVGTPTYAVPTWMVRQHPDILATTAEGKNEYGPRQNMDITNPTYLFYAERAIRMLIYHVKDHPAVIGYQIDNETKHYNTAGPNVQHMFVKYCKRKFSLDELNDKFGLDYWSNRINSWEDFPSVNNTINMSLRGEFEKFRRKLVTDFLSWQADIIREYKREDQFITHNFDFEFRGYSYGIQPDVDHFSASSAVDIAGCDIYHPSQEELTGAEIALGGDITRSMKQNNYLVLETEAQGFAEWVPFPNQLRLQAFSHIASGASMVAYWHWHSLHNAVETYWKGLLSHDFASNPTYEEAKTIGKDFERLSKNLLGLRKENDTAILFSNQALTALNGYVHGQKIDYNDLLRKYYDALYRMNIECDFVDPFSANIENYRLLIVPGLYAASDALLTRLNKFVEEGGYIVYSLRSGFCDENVKVRSTPQPGIINKACGVFYNQFVASKGIGLRGNPFNVGPDENKLTNWMELLIPDEDTEVLAYYDHKYWGKYAAITLHQYGDGTAAYVGCIPGDSIISELLKGVVKKAGLWSIDQEIEFPLITRKGINKDNNVLHFYFNYSSDPRDFVYRHNESRELLTGKHVKNGEKLELEPWGVFILEEE